MSLELGELLAGARFPKINGTIPIPGGQEFSVRREGRKNSLGFMPRE
jgi:hypothetical protein